MKEVGQEDRRELSVLNVKLLKKHKFMYNVLSLPVQTCIFFQAGGKKKTRKNHLNEFYFFVSLLIVVFDISKRKSLLAQFIFIWLTEYTGHCPLFLFLQWIFLSSPLDGSSSDYLFLFRFHRAPFTVLIFSLSPFFLSNHKLHAFKKQLQTNDLQMSLPILYLFPTAKLIPTSR